MSTKEPSDSSSPTQAALANDDISTPAEKRGYDASRTDEGAVSSTQVAREAHADEEIVLEGRGLRACPSPFDPPDLYVGFYASAEWINP